MTNRKKIIIGISGATGIVYGIRLLQVLKEADIETHLVVSKAGDMTREYETNLSAKELRQLADVYYNINDFGAAISSGSFKTMGMIVAPCSIRTLSDIAFGTTDNLLTRSADEKVSFTTAKIIYICLSQDSWGDKLPRRLNFKRSWPVEVQQKVLKNWKNMVLQTRLKSISQIKNKKLCVKY